MPRKLSELVDYSSASADLCRLHGGFESVGRRHLLPPSDSIRTFNPLKCYRRLFTKLSHSNKAIQQHLQNLNTKTLSYRLSHVFAILFPEEAAFTTNAHQAWADVYVLQQVTQALFDQASKSSLQGKITKYLKHKDAGVTEFLGSEETTDEANNTQGYAHEGDQGGKQDSNGDSYLSEVESPFAGEEGDADNGQYGDDIQSDDEDLEIEFDEDDMDVEELQWYLDQIHTQTQGI